MIQALLVKTGDDIYAMPVIHTIETLEAGAGEIKTVQGNRVIVLRDEVIPVFSLAELLNKEFKQTETAELVLAEVRDKKVAIQVDKVLGQQEVAIKSLGEFLKFAKGFSGVTILGDGKISLIIDVPALV
ncbi:MAG TPA: hypothetical protein ENN55_02300 [Firmicutes bacterium]|nr:hypothetical protein [Bacillota bacterium]